MATCQEFFLNARLPFAAIVWFSVISFLWGQAPDISATPQIEEAQQPDHSGPNADSIREQIERLSDPSYRTRQMARTFLEENPLASLAVIDDSILEVETVVGLQLVDLLSGLAVHSDFQVSGAATEILARIASGATSIGRSSANSLRAIADLQEEKAVEILTNQGAYIGPQNFSINGRLDRSGGPLSLRIDDSFWGTDRDLEWIRFLKSVQVVYLRGPKITPIAFQALSQLKQVRAVRLRSVEITPQQLLLLQELGSLEHLGLSYMEVDDSFIPTVLQLPINQSIRLYGTRVSELGEKQLNEALDGIEIFRGAGGFLGISSISRQAQVDQVTPGSAAAQAGVVPGDIIVSINKIRIATFDELRIELGKYRVGDTIDIVLRRPVQDRFRQTLDWVEMLVQAKLQEEDS
jgi:hypothetical protein